MPKTNFVAGAADRMGPRFAAPRFEARRPENCKAPRGQSSLTLHQQYQIARIVWLACVQKGPPIAPTHADSPAAGIAVECLRRTGADSTSSMPPHYQSTQVHMLTANHRVCCQEACGWLGGQSAATAVPAPTANAEAAPGQQRSIRMEVRRVDGDW